MGFFTIGSGISMEPLGEGMGATIGKSKRWIIPLLISFGLGLLITIAEPDLTVLAEQVPSIPNLVLIWSVGVGVGIFLVISIIRTRKGIKLNTLLLIFYGLIIVLAFFAPDDFIPTAFDSGGVTGGALTSAFLTPLTLSIAQSVAAARSGELSILANGFGIISFISVTPLIAIQALGIIYNIRLMVAAKTARETFEDLTNFVMEAEAEYRKQITGESEALGNA